MTERLVGLFHRRWAAPVLRELFRSGGAKLVTLVHRLGVSRSALMPTLRDLQAAGRVVRNPGYGHPLRPEYVLRPEATGLASACAKLLAVLEEADLVELGLRKWSMPILCALEDGARRFSEIRNALPGLGDRALTLALRSLGRAGIVDREVVDLRPPSSVYRATPATAPILLVLGRHLRPALEEGRGPPA
ncbi:MAG: winged helix-turn-helix transcriptional regulator [Planctomycetota bacterium]